MFKSAIILFVTCFLLYLPFSRQPDYFDSETAPAIIEIKGDTITAHYSEFGKSYYLKLETEKYKNKVGSKIEVIYELSRPEKAVINKAWGYWLIPMELAWSFGLFAVLLGIAYATTHRPHPAALDEQLNFTEVPKKKYE